MIRMEEKNLVEGGHGFGLELHVVVGHREHHVQKIRGIFVFLLRINDRQPERLAISKSRNRPHLRNQPSGVAFEFRGVVRTGQFPGETPAGIDH